ncbi:hypothetical protein [uncultured Enterococcus sp.]|uniref:hypothetical protein n=1 Tax=uncultured Enterococcus sp. TaxID=167972 RepID=UPI0025D64E15|nr:hypothetical protein [uncultured Enterococcus sp.]
MNDQIDVTGILGQEETEDPQNPMQPGDGNTTKPSTTQTYYGVLPSTNEYLSFYLLGLGVTICLTVLVLHRLKKLSNQLKSTDRR